MSGLWPCALIAALSGCAAPRHDISAAAAPTGSDRAAVAEAIAGAADQVKSCYRTPRVPRSARQIITILRVRYAMDGTLAEVPALVRQASVTETNGAYAGAMAQAAIDAVMRCTPVKLPPELYSGGWQEFELTFSPRGLA